MPDPGLTDGVVLLRQWQADDADWYADSIRDPVIQRYTSEPPALTTDQVRAAIADLANQAEAVGFVVCDATSGQRLGNIALRHTVGTGEVSYWVAAPARGRGVATRALRLLSDWAFAALELSEIQLWTVWVPDISITSCDLRILVNQPTESIPPYTLPADPATTASPRPSGGSCPKERCGRCRL